MPRLPYAAETLIAQVLEAKPKAKYSTPDGPDGIGVYRTVQFDKTTSKWLEPVLEAINDPRIAVTNMDGYLQVVFTAGNSADLRDRFPISEVEAVLRD